MHMKPFMPTDTFCSDTLYVSIDPTVYRALLKSAVSGTCHRIHITKKNAKLDAGGRFR